MAWTFPSGSCGASGRISSTPSTPCLFAARARRSSPCTTSRSIAIAALMSRKDRVVFRRVVPRAVREAARVLTVSERTKADLVELYGIPPERIVVTPNGVDPAFAPGPERAHVHLVRALRRGDSAAQEPARRARGRANAAGCRSSSSGRRRTPPRGRAASAEAHGSRDTSTTERLAELYRGAACLVQSSRHEGFGLPVVEAMASGPRRRGAAIPRCVRSRATPRSSWRRARSPTGSARARRARAARGGGPRARPRIQLARVRRADARRIPGDTRRVKVSAVVVSHGHADELDPLLPALVPRSTRCSSSRTSPRSVRDVPTGSSPREPAAARFAANVNLGIASTSGEYVSSRIPTRSPSQAPSRRSWSSRTRIRAAGSPARRCAGPTAPGSRLVGAFRPCAGPSCGARRCGGCARRTRRSASTTSSTSARPSPSGRLDARRLPAHAPHHARGDRRLGRGLPALLRGHRPLLPRRAGGVGAVVRARRRRHARLRSRDRPADSYRDTRSGTRAEWRAVRAQASRAAPRAVSDKGGQYARQATDWTERAYADVTAYLAHRAELIVALGPKLEPGDEVLDLACGDGGLESALLARGLRYRGVDSTPEMVAAARARLGDRAPVDEGDLNDYVPPAPRSPRRPSFARSTTRSTAARSSRTYASTRRRSWSSTSIRGSTAWTTCSRTCAPPDSARSSCGPSSSRRPSRSRPAARPPRRSSAAAARAPRAQSTLHLPRCGFALAAEQRLEAGALDDRAEPTTSLRDGSTSLGRRSASVISIRHGTSGGSSVVPLASQSGTSNRRVSVTWSMRGCLSGPMPTGPMRTVTLPVVRALGSGHHLDPREAHDCEPGLVLRDVVAGVGRAGVPGSLVEPVIQPSLWRPTSASCSCTGPPSIR